jgi:hypothetical protein
MAPVFSAPSEAVNLLVYVTARRSIGTIAMVGVAAADVSYMVWIGNKLYKYDPKTRELAKAEDTLANPDLMSEDVLWLTKGDLPSDPNPDPRFNPFVDADFVAHYSDFKKSAPADQIKKQDEASRRQIAAYQYYLKAQSLFGDKKQWPEMRKNLTSVMAQIGYYEMRAKGPISPTARAQMEEMTDQFLMALHTLDQNLVDVYNKASSAKDAAKDLDQSLTPTWEFKGSLIKSSDYSNFIEKITDMEHQPDQTRLSSLATTRAAMQALLTRDFDLRMRRLVNAEPPMSDSQFEQKRKQNLDDWFSAP